MPQKVIIYCQGTHVFWVILPYWWRLALSECISSSSIHGYVIHLGSGMLWSEAFQSSVRSPVTRSMPVIIIIIIVSAKSTLFAESATFSAAMSFKLKLHEKWDTGCSIIFIAVVSQTDLRGCSSAAYREKRRGRTSENRNRWARYLKIKSTTHEVLMRSTWKDDRLLLRWYPGLARHNELTSHELKLCYSGAEETLKAPLSIKLGFLDVVSFFRNCMCMLESVLAPNSSSKHSCIAEIAVQLIWK